MFYVTHFRIKLFLIILIRIRCIALLKFERLKNNKNANCYYYYYSCLLGRGSPQRRVRGKPRRRCQT